MPTASSKLSSISFDRVSHPDLAKPSNPNKQSKSFQQPHFYPNSEEKSKFFFNFLFQKAFQSQPSFIMLRILAVLVISQIVVSNGAKCVFYGSPSETGEQTANGEDFDPNGFTCSAMPHLPFNTYLRVTNQINGRSITVRVNDRFGAPPGEDTIDLTYGAFGAFADHDDGVVPCSYDIL